MALDEVLLQSAEAGVASLRFYTWDRPTLSLGYFQIATDRLRDPLLKECDWLRRASGGGAIMHHHELTYCLAVPAQTVKRLPGSLICRMHHFIEMALSDWGVSARAVNCGDERKLGEFLCFLDQTPGDLLIDRSKIVGSAQRKRHGAVMQHGSILLMQSEHTPSLKGVAELSGKSIDAGQLSERLGKAISAGGMLDLHSGDVDDEEREGVEVVRRDKFAADAWNNKR